MNVAINAIKVESRHRTDLGDIEALAESIRELGLLHPIVVTPDHRLVAGQRRLEACRLLGFDQVAVNVVRNLNTALAVLRAERDENTCRKEMTPSERKSLTDALLELERPAAQERMSEAGSKAAPGRPAERSGQAAVPFSGEATELAAKGAGWSRTSYRRATEVIEAAEDQSLPEPVREVARQARDDMDAGKTTVTGAATKVAAAKIVHAPDAAAKKLPASERVAQIRALTDRRYTAHQIADVLDISIEQVRKVARSNGITLVRTGAVRRGRKSDAQIIEHVVVTLAGLTLDLDDLELDLEELDADSAREWATSLSGSMKSLNRISRALKEMARA